MPHYEGTFFPKGMNKTNDVAGQLQDVVGLNRLRPVGLAIAALVGRNRMKTRFGQGG